MEQPETIHAVCRDGVPATCHKVPYEGKGGGTCLFGYRHHPEIPNRDEEGFINDGPDIWSLGGRWLPFPNNHAFDLIKMTIMNQGQEVMIAHA